MKYKRIIVKIDLEDTILFVLSCYALLWIAIYNAYPTVYYDSGTYIGAGFSEPTVDRPYWYCLFVRHTSLWTSLWFVVIAQAILVVTQVMIFFKYVIGGANVMRKTFLTILIASFTTGVSYYTSEIMPDIFAAMSLLSIAILFSGKTPMRISLYLITIMIFSAMAHTSVFLTNLILAGVLTLWCLVFRRSFRPFLKTIQTRLFIGATLLTMVLIPLMNYSVGCGFSVSRAGNIFLLKRIYESGILREYLAEHCKDNGSPYCKYQKAFEPLNIDFLWDINNSPLYDSSCKVNGFSSCWPIKNEEYAPLVSDVLTTPKYLFSFAKFAAAESFSQLHNLDWDDLNPMLENSPVDYPMFKYFKNELNTFRHARQQTEPYALKTLNLIQYLIVSLILIAVLLILVIKKWRDRLSITSKAIILVCICGFIFNAAVCATFSQVGGRFQARVIWLVILLAAMIIAEFLPKKKQNEMDGSTTI